jgi:glycosyltransferase involved in cell wall biosynthesis
MKVLMFGWEFPPFNHGGLGTACQGITRGLIQHGTEIYFVLPKIPRNINISTAVKIVNADQFTVSPEMKKHLKIIPINSSLLPYQTCMGYEKYLTEISKQYQLSSISSSSDHNCNLYGQNLYDEVHRYAAKAYNIAKHHPHDLIHAHDWMTYPAAEIAKKTSGKQVIAHIHATEFDRTGDHPNQEIYDLERHGLEIADHIICVSEYTKKKIIQNYGIPEDKIEVVHNAVDQFDGYLTSRPKPKLQKKDKIVLFLGRMTMQKGPDYFVEMAAKVLQKMPRVKFVMAGSGDMMEYVINRSAQLGIAKNILFTGFLRGVDIDRVYQSADLYVMPSVSEPFGITPLEAIKHGTPVLISKQSGVSEILVNALKVDFWDVDEMANKVLATLHYYPLQKTLIRTARDELKRMSWEKQAGKIKKVYEKVLKRNN